MRVRPSIDRLREVLRYEDGELYWRITLSNSAVAGKQAGTSLNTKGYRKMKVDKTPLLVHRVVWAICTGEWPKDQLDHIDGDRASIRIENLREASQVQNMGNRKLNKNNTTGYKGVSRNGGRYMAQSQEDGKHVHLGYFATAQEAHAAYSEYAKARFGEFARAE